MKAFFKSALLALSAFILAISLIKYPDQSLEASIRGLNLWLEIVFPSLLPFFITAELLIAFGVVKFLGILCEPFMRPLFNVPGAGSFVWAMGMASGYPSGAKLTARLRQENHLTRVEAERLVSFTNASNPLFIIGAISVGFFHDPGLGALLAVSHYLGNFLVGICMRFYGVRRGEETEKPGTNFSITKAFQALHQTRINDRRPIGKILGDAVLSSLQTLFMIGGFIIIFSVINKLMFLIGITPIISKGLNVLLSLVHLPESLSIPFIAGLFEITLGSQMTAQSENVELLKQAVLISFILAFNGFSVQAQVASILADTDIRFIPYFFARIIHGFFASFLCMILYEPLYLNKVKTNLHEVPVDATPVPESFWYTGLSYVQDIGPVVSIMAIFTGVIILLKRRVSQHKFL
ncbi:MAG: sporulation integral membrane protein YlbJ [Bacillaceae bacterium]|nr:sporulation integral membrane protein YlbJ [Bacillaceae bacterium]